MGRDINLPKLLTSYSNFNPRARVGRDIADSASQGAFRISIHARVNRLSATEKAPQQRADTLLRGFFVALIFWQTKTEGLFNLSIFVPALLPMIFFDPLANSARHLALLL